MSRNRGAYVGPDAEELARSHGATHVPCRVCQQPAKKPDQKCGPCQTAFDHTRYLSLPCRDWDEDGLIWSETFDEMFYAPEDLVDVALQILEAEEVTELNLLVYPMKPVGCPVIDDCDFFEQYLAPGGELPDSVRQAVDAYNKAVEGITISYEPDYSQRLYCDLLLTALAMSQKGLDENGSLGRIALGLEARNGQAGLLPETQPGEHGERT